MRALRSPWFRRAGAAAALVLLAAAVWVAASQVDPAVLADASWPPLALIGLLVMVNLAATGLLVWSVTRSFDVNPPVTPWRMMELIAVSALLNYLPLPRSGLFGRTAYLKLRHNLPIRQSLIILAVVTALAVVVCAGALVALLPVAAGVRWGIGLVGVAFASAATPRLAGMVLRRPMDQAWAWIPLRTIDLLAAAARLWTAFEVIGLPIGFDEAVVMGAASVLIRLVGVTPNGLGLSEWAVAGLAGLMAPISTAQGVLAALVDRGVEIIVVAVAGAVSAWRLMRIREPLSAPVEL